MAALPDISTAPPPGNDGSVRFSFPAPSAGGRLFVNGLGVTQVTLSRAGSTINTGVTTNGYVAVSPGDICTVSYYAAQPPQLVFV